MAATGLEGVVAFETEIAEPDRDGNALRYRGVDIEELVGRVPFEEVWSLLVGGGRLAGTLLAEIDELIVKLYPVVAGAGVPMFAAPFTPTALALRRSQVLQRGTVVLTYDLVRT